MVGQGDVFQPILVAAPGSAGGAGARNGAERSVVAVEADEDRSEDEEVESKDAGTEHQDGQVGEGGKAEALSGKEHLGDASAEVDAVPRTLRALAFEYILPPESAVHVGPDAVEDETWGTYRAVGHLGPSSSNPLPLVEDASGLG